MKQEEVWDAIAEKWQDFRPKPVGEVKKFLKGKRGRVLYLGCVSGRNFIALDGVDFYGVDFSSKLLDFIDEGKYVELKKGVTYDVPYPDSFFDYVVFARVLHCVDSKEKRRKSLEECYRVLKSGGEIIISSWARGHGRLKNKDKESFVPWSVGGKKYERYTYIYDLEELRKELEEVGFEVVWGEEGKNVVFLVRKG
jgi:SAM-dependent methyltransferase